MSRECLSNCLGCRCLGDRIFGQDVDSIFAYQTPKVVKIEDRVLGLLRLLLILVIFVYIFIFNIWFKGEHFVMSNVDGIARLQWQQPTKGWCNPMKLACESNFQPTTELPYCNSYTGTEPSNIVRQCEFYDAQELPHTLRLGEFMPTRIREFKQKLTCDELSQTCTRKYTFVDSDGQPQRGDGKAMPVSDVFVADIEDFALLIDHSFRTANGKRAFDDFNMQGYYMSCKDDEHKDCEKKKIPCAHKNCNQVGVDPEEEKKGVLNFFERPSTKDRGKRLSESGVSEHSERRSHGRTAGRGAVTGGMLRRKEQPLAPDSFLQLHSVTHGMVNLTDATEDVDVTLGEEEKDETANNGLMAKSIEDGDVFSLRTLLAMAGTSLDDLADPKSGSLETIRERGTAIVMRIEYNNMHPWQLLHPQNPPEYTISVTRRPTVTFKDSQVGGTNEEGRSLRTSYGVYLVIQQAGSIGTFSLVQLLITVTAGMTLLAMSNVLTDVLAQYVLPRKDIFQNLKYQVSEDYVTVNKDEKSPKEEEKPPQHASL